MNRFCLARIVFAIAVFTGFSVSVHAATPDPQTSCSNENVEKCRASHDQDCRKVIGLLCSEAGHTAFKKQRYSEAQPFLNRACRLEVGNACFVLGTIELAQTNKSKARVYFLSGCQFDSDKSCDALLKMGGRDPQHASVQDPQELGTVGKAWLQTNMGVVTPCEKLNAEACYRQGAALAKQGQRKEALAVLKVACEKKHAGSCNRVGWELKSLNQIQVAQTYFENACTLGERKGCNNLAWYHEKEFRMDQALQYYAKACQLGHNKACARRDELQP